ncbi:PREDICTED: lachesin-like isoform X3 [Papilio xuthus]|uniref:Lachesin-like isoform X3 n=2 Tax=Papilio xuthus TaxID=66420 RepID=A0AAJ7E3T3_PAPXU|nr:PREDICTED: lachesin-like isoform X3 [Papilio xuthus]
MAGKLCGDVLGVLLALVICLTRPEHVSSAQRELGKGVPGNASATSTPGSDNAIRAGPAGDGPRPTPRTGPYFDLAMSKNVTALLGKTAYLNCRVKNLGNKTLNMQVSWVRHRDIHLLTVGRYTYTSDQRFRAIHLPHSEDWTLQIKYPQHRDSGIYECQISTTPHMSHFIHLNVVEPTTEIIGGPDLYIDRGSTINLTCVVLYSPEPPAYIFWNHNDAIISYDSPRGGVSVVTEKGETTTSFLLIQQARPSDSGTYQCNPSNAQSKSVMVHVLNGEYPAAMQRGGQAFAPTSPAHCFVLAVSLLISLS